MAQTDTVSWSAGLKTILRISRMALDTPGKVAIAILATILASALQLWIPVLLGQAIDQMQSVMAMADAEASRGVLLQTATLVLGVSVLRGIFTTLQNYFSEAVGHHTGYALRQAYYDKIQHLSFGFHDRVHSGDLITLGMLDLEGVRMFFATGLVRLVLLVILIGFGGAMLVQTDPFLAVLALSFVPFVGWKSSVSQLRLRRTWLELQDRMSVLSRVMEENLAGIKVVRAFSAGPHEMVKFRDASVKALDLAHERVDLRVGSTTAMTLSYLVAMALVLLVGGLKVQAGEITLGTLAAFLTFMTILQMPVRQLGMLVNSFARTSTCGARIFALLDLKPVVADAKNAPELEISEGVLRFEGVSFAYPSAPEHKVLDDLSFEAKRGEIIGIVGPQGSGKTTIAQLIPRFYDVGEGRITIDGQDLRSVRLRSLRRSVAVVQQDVFMFTTSLENNIAYGDPWASPRRIEKASDSAQISGYIDTLPEGYRTVVGERAASLSGGQRQRLSIARSLMLKPDVLVFDDSTAAIDARTEESILTALKDEAAERITILIAHRLNTLRHADRILVLDHGRIAEEGSHAELMALKGRYAALHAMQTLSHEGAA
ncbi:ABC transporter ATP-binding protein [Rhodobacter sp. ETT8]|uniref:ABC transporter ATP-binding protein n=2 Tax=Pseudotabrizicola algicola TaxID=2709381 RepID=A0A6B3RRL8_9RHOB|nr:ABC transporter ATP-binding protein [Pseudotabrizicola algicola]